MKLNVSRTNQKVFFSKKLNTLAFSFFILIQFLAFDLSAQLVGGRENGQSAPSEVGASSITAGGFSGEVSLFTGTYNSSYTLGSVSTVSGLSFTASLSYSSTFSTGENMPHTSGIPYGEGWSVDIPMISVSTENYNKYTLWEINKMRNNNSEAPTRDFDLDENGNPSCDDATKEGDLYWFSPTLNIPGVASGRLVFKYMNASDEAVFVLNKFERYIEVIKRGNVWEVILDNGTRYEMNVEVLSHRNSANQRVQRDCVNPSSSKNMLLPKSEITTWYCTRIRNVNAIGSISFVYNAFGSFDYYKELKQAAMLNAIDQYWFFNDQAGIHPPLKTTYKDVILKEIYSGSEKLVLDYGSVLAGGMNGILDINDTENVSRLDSMYSYTTVKKWGGTNGLSFADWYRYKHLKSEGVAFNKEFVLSKLNPYKGRFDGENPLSGYDVYYREAIAQADYNQIPFDHSYLESPRIDLIPGETYEIRTLINTPNFNSNTSLGNECSFDINLATGDNQTNNSYSHPPSNPSNNATGIIPASDYEQSRGQSIFSTFNQGIKWNNAASINSEDSDLMKTSNFFTMANLPNAFQGFQVQVGPGISDNAFALNRADISYDASLNVELDCNILNNPIVCNSYLNSLWLEDNSGLRGNGFTNRPGGDIPNNFGIGIPWYMARELYEEAYNGDYGFCNENSAAINFWWWLPLNPYTYNCANTANRPTRADHSKLKEVALIRYSKNPYMLKRVTKYVLNMGDGSTTANSNEDMWREISSMGFSYDIVKTPLYVHHSPVGAGTSQFDYNTEQQGYRNIMRLKKIRQLPRNWDAENATTEDINALPTTHLEYDSLLYNDGFSFLGMNLNSSIAILNKVVDPLGKETKISYDGNYFSTQFQSNFRPSDLTPDQHVIRRASPSAYQIYMKVKDIEVTDRESSIAKRSYSYGARKSINQLVPMNEHFKYDYQANLSIGHSETTVLGPEQNGKRPKTVYHHYTDHYLTWGKLHKVETFDADDKLISESASTYEAVLAFENPMHRIRKTVDKYDYYEYKAGIAPYTSRPQVNASFPTDSQLKIYYDSLYKWMEVLDPDYLAWAQNLDLDAPSFTCNQNNNNSCNCYDDFEDLNDVQKEACLDFFDRYQAFLKQLSTIDANYLQDNHPDFKAASGMYEAPEFYESRYYRTIQQTQPHLLNSYFIKKTEDRQKTFDNLCSPSGELGRAAIETITTYEYFDADYMGNTNSSGYAALTAGGIFDGLYYEPSWQLYSKKTSSSEIGGYTLEENFYLYDLINDQSYWDEDGKPNPAFYDLWRMWTNNKMRNLVFQTRVTTQAEGEDAISQSSYYNYSRTWEVDQDVATITYESSTDLWPCQSDEGNNGGSGGIGGGPNWDYLPTGCFTYPVQSNTIEYCPVYLIPQAPIYCPCDMTFDNDPPSGGQNATDDDTGDDTSEIPSNPLQGKLMLKSVVQQVKALAGDNYVLRFSMEGNSSAIESPVYPTGESGILTLKTILSRGKYGQIVKEEDNRGIILKYEYEPYHIIAKPYCWHDTELYHWTYLTNHIGLPKAVIVGYGRADSLRTTYSYNLDNSIKEVLDPNDLKLNYEYDNFGRMVKAFRNDELLQEASYSHWENDHTQDFKARALMNFVDQRNHIETGKYFGSQAYVDPLGRNVANVNYGGVSSVAVENNIFDIYGRAIVQLQASGGGPAINLNGASTEEHAEFEYDIAPLNRPLKSSKYGESIQGNHIVKYAYCLVNKGDLLQAINATGKTEGLDLIQGQVFSRMETLDEDNKPVVEFSNALGQKVASITNDGTIATVFHYDSFGNVKEVSNAKEQKSRYNYNYLGQLYEKITVDGGTSFYAYDHSGNLLCEAHANEHISMYRYDDYGRMTEQKNTTETYLSHEGRPWLEERDYATYLTIMDNATFEKSWHYESYDDTSPNIAGNAKNYLENSLTHAKGKVVQTTSYNLEGNPVEYRFVSYTKDGFLKWEISQFNQNGLQSGGEGILSRIDYPSYNLQGSYKLQNVDLNCDQTLDFQYAYTYDTWNRLENVYVNYDDKSTNGHLIASYEYDDAMGVVTKKSYTASGTSTNEITGAVSICKNVLVDVIDYSYDTRFRLTDINSNLFDWNLYYDAFKNDDHLDNFVENYNGNINASLGTYKFALAETVPENFGEFANSAYNYQYDQLNRLTLADAKISLINPLTDGEKLGDTHYAYDKIGNIERLNRWRFNPQGVQAIEASDYIYNYAQGSNQLLSVSEDVISNGGTTITSNATATYGYDNSGNLMSDSKRQLTIAQYGRAHLPWYLSKTSDVVIAGPEGGTQAQTSNIRYLYDANDARIYKSAQGNLGPKISEYYLRTASGQELAIYDLNTDELTWYVYGNERVAKIKNDPTLRPEEEDDRDTEYDGIPTTPPSPPVPPGTGCISKSPRCLGFGTNLQRDLILNTQLASLHAQNNAQIASLQTLYSSEESGQLNLPDTWMQLEMADQTTEYVLQSQISTIQGEYTIVDQLVLNSTAQQIQLSLNGNSISLSLSEVLGEEVGEEAPNDDDGPDDPFYAPLVVLADPGVPEASYYVQDHLGNTRVVYKPLFCGVENASGEPVEYDVEYVGDYFPYAKTIREYVKGKKEKFLTTHHERDEETGLDYRGARFYDADVARFLSLDPLAADYPTLSDYSYVAGNPIIYTDPDGRQIVITMIDSNTDEEFDVEFRDGSFYRVDTGKEFTGDVQFLNDIKAAYTYLSESEDAKKYIDLIAADKKHTVEIQEIIHMFMRGDAEEIGWNATSGLGVDDGDQTPAIGLLHEIGHTYLKWNPEVLDGFEGSEDDWIFENIESLINEPQRKGHTDGYPIATVGPTSTEPETKRSRKERKKQRKREKKDGVTNKLYKY